MNIGTPRTLLHAARLRANPEIDYEALADREPAQEADPVERVVVVQEPVVPDHIGELAGEPTAPQPFDALEPESDPVRDLVPDDLSELAEELDDEHFPS